MGMQHGRGARDCPAVGFRASAESEEVPYSRSVVVHSPALLDRPDPVAEKEEAIAHARIPWGGGISEPLERPPGPRRGYTHPRPSVARVPPQPLNGVTLFPG